ncbi:MAG: hypothetical protein A4E61_00495 [Syntrophorhabdus sp. PtaB.Bin184]|nr:MAG: hypothetical protein A4E61_00495 [Syntrophorhabdus sp. PtaB.Bin184]
MVHNEGNISLLTLLDLHIVVVGVDKLVPTLEDAAVLIQGREQPVIEHR